MRKAQTLTSWGSRTTFWPRKNTALWSLLELTATISGWQKRRDGDRAAAAGTGVAKKPDVVLRHSSEKSPGARFEV